MGLNLNGSTQWLQAAWAPGVMQPMTFMAWIRRDILADEDSIVCAGDIDSELAFNNMQARQSDSRAISFNAYAEAQGAAIPISTVTFICAVFSGSTLTIYVDDDSGVSQAWSPGSDVIDQLRIGNSVSSNSEYLSPFDGVLEHVAIWNVALNSTQVSALQSCTTSPSNISGLVAYLPLIDSLTDSVGTLSWSAQDLSSPSYTSLGISYGGTTYTVTYDGNGNTSGTAPTDGSSPYSSGATVTVLGNTGTLEKTNYTWEGWNTAADGSGTHYDASDTFEISGDTTLYAEWDAVYQYRTINHLNCDPSDYTDAEIVYASMMKVYMEHASTGQDIVGDSDTDSSTGNNYDSSATCGLAQVYEVNNRYLLSRDSHSSGNDYTWYATHSGLQTNHRGNPTPATKISGFLGMSSNMRGAIGVAMFKYCWIDVWTETSGYISDGAAAAASDIEDIEAFEAANPDIIVVRWTMPLQDDASYAAREAYNSAIRTDCLNKGKWLFDIADIECYNDSNVKQVDGNNREIATTSYMRDDGGHLGTSGRLKAGYGFWSLLAAIANDGGSATYTVNGVTYNKDGSILGGCVVSLFKHAGSGVFSYIGTTTSNATTGAYSLVAPDNDAAYMVVAFKGDSPHVFDVSDYVLTPDFTEPT